MYLRTCLSSFLFFFFFARSGMSPNDIISKHIKDLKEYNELRDAGLRMVQIVADEKKVSLREVVEEIGYSIKDN